ncbi:GAG-binding domain-containing protein [Streptococcus ruminantium]|uniref:GAG-binding domain-containing protein n=1 Tax=Streptococcus ruminantium TaxID=1917441 RepID=UPI0012DF820D|nr:GAG-binding domain-containing protein [Streptococcus ruminantium]
MTPQKKRHYSIRKLQAGAGSILIGTTLLFGLSTQLVQANTTADGTTTSGSAGGTTAAPSVTATGTDATTATGGGTATTEEKPKVEEPKEKPVEETAPKVEDKKEAETPNAATNPADFPIVKELEKLLKEVEELPELESTDYFKGQIKYWNGDDKSGDVGLGKIAKSRLRFAHGDFEGLEPKFKEEVKDHFSSKEKAEAYLYDSVQHAKIEKMARQAQDYYKKHNDEQLLKLIKEAFDFNKNSTYASLEGPTHLGVYMKDDLIPKFEKIEKLAKELEEKAKKEKEKEQPAPEEPKKDEQPAPEKPEDKDKSEKTPDSQPQQPEDKDKPTPEKPEKQPEDTNKPEEAPKKPEDTEKPAPSQPKQDDSMKKDYKLFYQTKDKTEEVNFKGTPEELKATLDKAIEKYKQDGYPYVDRFERENRILLVFNQHKSIIVLETNGDGGSRQSRPFYGTPQELEAEIKKLTESLSDTYKIEKKEGYDKLDPTVKTITLVLTKLSDTPKETPAPKKEDKPTPPEDKKPEQPKKDKKQTQPEDKKPEQPKKDEKQTQPEDKKAEKPKDEKQTQPEGKKAEKPKDKQPAPAPKKAEKAMPSKARTPKKVLPNTGEVPSILAVLGSGLLGFLGMSQIKRRKK